MFNQLGQWPGVCAPLHLGQGAQAALAADLFRAWILTDLGEKLADVNSPTVCPGREKELIRGRRQRVYFGKGPSKDDQRQSWTYDHRKNTHKTDKTREGKQGSKQGRERFENACRTLLPFQSKSNT